MIRELLIALLVMFIFLFAGEKILAFLNLRAETVSISGGIILFLIAIKMIFPSAEGSSSGLPAGEEPFIVPLAIPLVAGPTILATLMLLSHQYPNQMSHLVIALLIAWGGTFIILLQSSLFLRLLGEPSRPVRVCFMPPILPGQCEGRRAIAQTARDRVAQAMAAA